MACKHAPPAPTSEVTDAGSLATTFDGVRSDAGAPPRCKVLDGQSARATLHDVGDRRSVEVGEAVATADGAVVGLVHSPSTGPEALVAQVAGGELKLEWVVAKRGELVPDAAPPKPLVAGGSVYAVYLARRTSSDGGASRTGRDLVLKKAGVVAPLAVLPERAAESFAFDAAVSSDERRAAVAWDDDDAKGGITVGIVPLAPSAGVAPPAPRIVSGDSADVDGPRIAPRSAGGWWVGWIAHRVDALADAAPEPQGNAGSIERPAEDRAFSWVEIVSVDEDGAPNGPPRRITSAAGRAASFDLAPRSRGAVDVVIRDELQQREGEGGRILHVLVAADGSADDPTTLVAGSAGRGSVDLVTGAGDDAWLAFSDTQDRAVVVPLSAARLAAGAPSVENAVAGGRLLSLTAPASGAEPAHFMAAFPEAEGPLFRNVACLP